MCVCVTHRLSMCILNRVKSCPSLTKSHHNVMYIFTQCESRNVIFFSFFFFVTRNNNIYILRIQRVYNVQIYIVYCKIFFLRFIRDVFRDVSKKSIPPPTQPVLYIIYRISIITMVIILNICDGPISF